jgi:hypothetical protein
MLESFPQSPIPNNLSEVHPNFSQVPTKFSAASLCQFIQLYSEPHNLDHIEQSELVSFVVRLSDFVESLQENFAVKILGHMRIFHNH